MSPKQRFKVYAKLLYLYPSGYRKQYGEQLLQTVADMVDDAPSTYERFIVWLRIGLDLPVTACKEHFQIIGDFMYAKNNHQINRNTFISGVLILLPVILVAINRMLMLSGPGRGMPTYPLIVITTIFPVLAVGISGFTLYTLLRSDKKLRTNNLRKSWPLGLVFAASLLLLTLIIREQINFYLLTH